MSSRAAHHRHQHFINHHRHHHHFTAVSPSTCFCCTSSITAAFWRQQNEDHREQQQQRQRSISPRSKGAFSDMSWVVLAGLFLVAFWGGFHISGFFLDSCGTTLHDSFVRYVYTPVLSQKSLQLTKSWLIANECWHVLVHTESCSSATSLVWSATLWVWIYL